MLHKLYYLLYDRFPLINNELNDQWINKVRRKKFTPTARSIICSEHFKDSSYLHQPGMSVRNKLKADAVPSIFASFPDYYQGKVKKPRIFCSRQIK